MDNAFTLASVIGPVYLFVGLSVLLYRQSWQKVYEQIQANHYALLPVMVAYIVLGIIMVNMYNVWAWNVWLLVTLTGWALIVKGVFYLLAPGSVVKDFLSLGQKSDLLYVGGVVALVIGAVLSYYVYFAA